MVEVLGGGLWLCWVLWLTVVGLLCCGLLSSCDWVGW